MRPSKYQEIIYKVFQQTNKDINISAVAGSGKTTVLLELLKFVPDGDSSLFLAFNNSIIDELRQRNKRRDVEIMTIHSCGWRSILSRYGGKVKMNPNKGIAKTEKVLKEFEIPDKRRGYFFYVVPKILDLMRCNLCENNAESITELINHYDIDVEEDDIKLVMKAFEYLIKDKSQFDFMDMIYVPVTDPSIRFKKYDYVFCDESQDFSICQHKFIKNCLNRKGRLTTVGDKRQAIYGFAGADAESYDRLANINGQAIKLPLSVSYRCAVNIVKEAQKIVPEISYAPHAIEGIVKYYDNGQPICYLSGDRQGEIKLFGATVQKKDAIEAMINGTALYIITGRSLNESLNIPNLEYVICTSGDTNASTYDQRTSRSKTVDQSNHNKRAVIINLFINDYYLNDTFVSSRDKQKLVQRQTNVKDVVWIENIQDLICVLNK